MRPKIIIEEFDPNPVTLRCEGYKGKYCLWTKEEINGTSSEIVVNGIGPAKNYELINKPEDGTCSLRINLATFEDSANLTCKILPSPYWCSAVWELEVGKAPANIFIENNNAVLNSTRPNAVEPNEEGNVELICVVRLGKPAATLQWIGDINPSDNITERTNITDSLTSVHSKLTMKIEETDEESERTVTCVSFHELYPHKLELVTVTVGLPYPTKSVSILCDESTTRWIEVTCGKADGLPEPNYRWQFKELNSESWQNLSDTDTTTLNDYGEYQCLAGNRLNGVIWATSSTKLILTEEGVSIACNSQECA